MVSVVRKAQLGGIAGLLLALSGCMGFLHPVQPAGEYSMSLYEFSACTKEHVHIFLLNGLDPCSLGNMTGVRDYCHQLGFRNTYYGQFFHSWSFARKMKQIQAEDPQARFVVFGFSAGAITSRSMVNDLQNSGITIDLLMYVGGATLQNEPRNRPANALKVVHIRGGEVFFRGAAIDGAENVKLTDIWHYGSPAHPETIRILTRELNEVVARAPAMQRALNHEAEGLVHTAHHQAGPPPEWSFLKVNFAYQEVPPPVLPVLPGAKPKTPGVSP
jgi:hypothetical protein